MKRGKTRASVAGAGIARLAAVTSAFAGLGKWVTVIALLHAGSSTTTLASFFGNYLASPFPDDLPFSHRVIAPEA